MARKKKRGPGRPKGSKTKVRRGRPPKAAQARKKKRGPGRPKGSKTKARRGRPPGAKTKIKAKKKSPSKALHLHHGRGRPAKAETTFAGALDSLAASFQSIAKSLDHISVMTIKTAEPHHAPKDRPAHVAAPKGLQGSPPDIPPDMTKQRAEPTTQAATRVGAQAQPIPADQGVQAQV
jgi:hypothetical protein